MFREEVQDRLDSLIKPEGNLGALEEIAAKVPMMQNRVIPGLPKKRAVCFFAAEATIEAMREMAMFEDASMIAGSRP